MSNSLKWSQVAQWGTRFELAISTRGASLWVLNTPTGLPDWTSRVSSSSSVLQAWRRCGRNPPRCGRRGRCRRRPPAHAGSRPRRGAGCSSASASAPRSASYLAVISGPVGGKTSRRLWRGSVMAGLSLVAEPGASRPGPPRNISAKMKGREAGGLGEGAAGDDPGGGGEVGGEVAVLGQGRDIVRAGGRRRPGAAPRWRAARESSMPWAAQIASTPRMRLRFSTIGARRRAPWAAMLTWSSWLALVGVESVDRRGGEMLVLAHQRGGGDLGDHQAGVEAGIGGEERRQVEAERRVDHQRDPALGDGADLGDRERDHVGGEAHRLGMEIAARDDAGRPRSAPAGCRWRHWPRSPACGRPCAARPSRRRSPAAGSGCNRGPGRGCRPRDGFRGSPSRRAGRA